MKHTFRDGVKVDSMLELPFALHGKSLGRALFNFNMGKSLVGLSILLASSLALDKIPLSTPPHYLGL